MENEQEDFDVEINPLDRKVGPVGWLYRNNKPTHRPLCYCCGGSMGVRKALAKRYKFTPGAKNLGFRGPSRGHKPKHKDHRR